MPRNKILLVDSDVENLRLYEISFRRAGFIPTIATDGGDALKKIELFQPDLIISEVNLPNMDGYEFCAEVKNDPRFRSIPFLFLTKEKSIENKVMGLELGADDYLVKPIFLKELITRAKMLVDRRDSEGMRVSGQKSLSGVLGEMEIVDLIQIMQMGVKSGIINLVFEMGEEGKIYFRRGKIVKIHFLGFEGIKAFFRILNRARGSFNVDFVEPEVEDNVEMTTHELVMEGMRWIDEWRGISEGMPPLDSVLAVNSDMILGSDPDEEVLAGTSNILGEFDGRRTIGEAIDLINESDLEVLKKVSHLYFEGYLIPVIKIDKEEKTEKPVPEMAPSISEPEPEPAQTETGPDYSIGHIFLEEAPAPAAPAETAGASSAPKKRTLAEIEKESSAKPKPEPAPEKPGKPTELEIEMDFFSEREESTQRLAPASPPAVPAPPPAESRVEVEIPAPVKEEVVEVKPPPRRKPISDEEMWFLPPEEAAQSSLAKKAEPKPPAAKTAAKTAPKTGISPAKGVETKAEKTPAAEAAPAQSEAPAPPKTKAEPAPVRRVQISKALIAGGAAALVALVAGSILLFTVIKKNQARRGQEVAVHQVPMLAPAIPAPKKTGGSTAVPAPAAREKNREAVPERSIPLSPEPEKKTPDNFPPTLPSSPREKTPAAPAETVSAPSKEKSPAPAPELTAAKPRKEPKPAPARPEAARPVPDSAPAPVIPPVVSAPVKKIDPEESRIHVIRGKALYLKGDKKGAVAEFNLAVGLNPQSPEAQFNLGMVLHEAGQVVEAVKALQAAVELNPRNPEAFRILGILYQKLGDQKNSSICFQKYLSLLSE